MRKKYGNEVKSHAEDAVRRMEQQKVFEVELELLVITRSLIKSSNIRVFMFSFLFYEIGNIKRKDDK